MEKNTGKAKKGMVINRKRNRTVNQDVAHSNPKWEDMGGGVLKLKAGDTYIRRGKNNRWENVKKPAQETQVAA
jgi:hypothetical protein